jgi:hypothetical protein
VKLLLSLTGEMVPTLSTAQNSGMFSALNLPPVV